MSVGVKIPVPIRSSTVVLRKPKVIDYSKRNPVYANSGDTPMVDPVSKGTMYGVLVTEAVVRIEA